MKMNLRQSVLIGSALSGLMLGACASSNGKQDSASIGGMQEGMGQCYGVNSCKGKGDCGGKGHSCAGKNSCKGKGYLKMSKDQCLEKGGEFKS